MATIDSYTLGRDRLSFKALPQPPSNTVRDHASFQSQSTPEPPGDEDRPLPRLSSLLEMVPDSAPPRESVILEHSKKPSASGSSIYSLYSSHTVGTTRSWSNTPEERQSTDSLAWKDVTRNTKSEPDSPVLGSKQEDQFELEDVLKTTQIMHSNSISSTTSSTGRPELWRRRSQKSDRSVNITDLKLVQSNGFTASQPLRNESTSNGPHIPLPAIPMKAPQRFAKGLPSQPAQFSTETSFQANKQSDQRAPEYSHPTTQYSQMVTGPAPYTQPLMQSQDNEEQTLPFSTKQNMRKPVPLRPAPPQPETIGTRLSNLKNRFRSTEQLRQSKDLESPRHTPQGSIDKAGSSPTGVLNKFRSIDDENMHVSSETKGSGSAFSKIKHKLLSTDEETVNSPDSTSPEGSSWNLSKLKNKLRNSGNADETITSMTPTRPDVGRLPTPDYQKQDPAPAPLTPHIQSPYSPQISPVGQVSQPSSGPSSRPSSRGRQLSMPQRPPRPDDALTPHVVTPLVITPPIFEEQSTPVDPSQAHIHPLLRTQVKASSSNDTLTTISTSQPRPTQPPPTTSSTEPSPPPIKHAPSPKTTTIPAPPAPPAVEESTAAAAPYTLQVPGEISKRMTTILESSPFLHLPPSPRGLDNTAVVYPAPALAVTQIQCYQGHRVMHRSRNDVYALACGVCGVRDREGRWCCAWCAVRCCEGCLEKVKREGLGGEGAGVEALNERGVVSV